MLTFALPERPSGPARNDTHLIGVLPGEGVGPEIVPLALELLAPLAASSNHRFNIRTGGAIGYEAERLCGASLSGEVIAFTEEIFAEGGALLCGPGGGRFVHELRKRFDLFCKFTPLQPLTALRNCGPVEPQRLAGVDIIAIRENVSGLYQGEWNNESVSGKQVAKHSFEYREDEVDRIILVALRLAELRQGRLCVVIKPGGVPGISRLWSERAEVLASGREVELSTLEIDNAVYQLVAKPEQFDVIVSPNMFGDVIADCGALLLGSRGMSYSGNFNSKGQAVYQTGHGAAKDIAGRDIANPLGQMQALAMMLEESFGWPEGADAIHKAIHEVLTGGYRSRDIAERDSKIVGTGELGATILRRLKTNLGA